ncbi:MAG: hypothetical protein V1850_00250 [Candidatus Bathyarchaeota archaeon]
MRRAVKIIVNATDVLAVLSLTLLLAGMAEVPPSDVASAFPSSEVTHAIGSSTSHTIPSGYI